MPEHFSELIRYLYKHVPNKEVLLELTVERMRSEMRLPDPLPVDWLERMACIFDEYRRVLAEPDLIRGFVVAGGGEIAHGAPRRLVIGESEPADDQSTIFTHGWPESSR